MTTTEAPSTALQIAFPRQDEGSMALAIPAQPSSPLSRGLEVMARTPDQAVEAKKTLSCKDLLRGQTLAQAQQDAQSMYRKMLDDTQIFMVYGTEALADVNSLVDRLLHEVEPVKIPELKELMQGLNKEMRGIQHKYDVSDPDVRKKYENWKGGIGRFFGKAHTLIELLLEDITSIETQLNKVAKELRGRQNELVRNVSFYDEIYEENEQEIGKLIYVIGVMEMIRDLAAQEAASIKVGDASLGDREGERQARIAEFANNMELKITEYKGRLFVAWATSPQTRMMRTLNVSLAERVNELVCVTIPTMKATIVQWRMLIESQDAAELSRAVQESSNEWLQRYSHAAEIAVPAIADAVQTPTITPETIMVMATSIANQADGIVRAMDAGAQRRQEIDDAILAAQPVLKDASHKITDDVIRRVISVANEPMPLELTTSVPSTNQT